MIDTNATIRAWLLSDDAIVAMVADRVYYPMLPQNYTPETNGLAITFSQRGGVSDEEAPIVKPSIQVVCWAAAGESVNARALYGAVWDLMHLNGANGATPGDGGTILSSTEETSGQDSIDPETKWATVTSFYRLIMRAV